MRRQLRGWFSVICDQIIALNGFCTKQDYLEHLCRIRVKDA